MPEEEMIARRLRTPRSAAIAGIIFALFMAASVILIRLSIASTPAGAASWLVDGTRRTAVLIGINLIPFAGIAFLWFMGVIRDRMGEREDKFFATVFMGSGLLFVAMLFVSAAIAIGMYAMFHSEPANAAQSEAWNFGRLVTVAMLNVFALRMAAVFMITSSTIALRTAVTSRWLAYLGYAIALVLLVASGWVDFINLLMPFWVLLVSLELLILSRRREEANERSLSPEGGRPD